MVFLIQNTQNRDSKALHLKLDELIKSTGQARNKMIQAEELSDQELKDVREEFLVLTKSKAQKTSDRKKKGRPRHVVVEEKAA